VSATPPPAATPDPADAPKIARRCALLALALLPLAACGRRGRPDYPEDVDPKYPRVYPVR